MKWKSVERLPLLEFRRLTGVKKPTFIKMIDIFQNAHQQPLAKEEDEETSTNL